MKRTNLYSLSLTLFLIIFLSGCKAGPGKKAGFIDTKHYGTR